ncbi:uncharacterized protein LOC144144770 isoform X1 [Haemaphysalis longicornis]
MASRIYCASIQAVSGVKNASNEPSARLIGRGRTTNLSRVPGIPSRTSSASRANCRSSEQQPAKTLGGGSCSRSNSSMASTCHCPNDSSGLLVRSVRTLHERHGHQRAVNDDAVSMKSPSIATPGNVDDRTSELRKRRERYAEIRTALLVGPIMMATVGNTLSFWTLPSIARLASDEPQGDSKDVGTLNFTVWALLTLPGAFGAMLFCCGYFYVANIWRPNPSKHFPEERAIFRVAEDKLFSPPLLRKGRYLFVCYVFVGAVILTTEHLRNQQPTLVSKLAAAAAAASALVASGVGDRKAFSRETLLKNMPWRVLCVLGGAQLVTRIALEGRLVERLFELVNGDFWSKNSHVTNQVILTIVACLLAEALVAAPLNPALLPALNAISSQSRTRPLYYMMPVSLALSTNMLGPVSLHTAMLYCAHNISLRQLALVGVMCKSILLTMLLVSINTTGNHYFHWNEPLVSAALRGNNFFTNTTQQATEGSLPSHETIEQSSI